jgi:hypothetical protein
MKIEKFVEVFKENVIKQNSAISEGRYTEGNKAAKKYIKAFKSMVEAHGDEGREELSKLLSDKDDGVRAMAAAFLLRYKTAEAEAVLTEISAGSGMISFGAGETLKRWAEGTWSLD